jgi:hypothetical protein
MKIEFYRIATGEVLSNTDWNYFVMSDVVCRDSYETCESQCSVVGFDDFYVETPDIGWRVKE